MGSPSVKRMGSPSVQGSTWGTLGGTCFSPSSICPCCRIRAPENRRRIRGRSQCRARRWWHQWRPRATGTLHPGPLGNTHHSWVEVVVDLVAPVSPRLHLYRALLVQAIVHWLREWWFENSCFTIRCLQ